MALDREDRIRDICYPHVVVADGPARATAAWLAAAIRLAIRQRGSCTVGLAGGSTPAPIYRELATSPLAQEAERERRVVSVHSPKPPPRRHGTWFLDPQAAALLAPGPVA